MIKQTVLYGLCLLVIVLQLVAITTNDWSVLSNPVGVDSKKISMGLWKMCSDQSGTGDPQLCIHIPSGENKNFPKHSITACRVFAIMGVVLIFIGLLCMYFCRQGVHRTWQLLLLIGGAVCSLISVIVWSAELTKIKDSQGTVTKFNHGYSWILMLVSGVLSLCAATYFQYGKGQPYANLPKT